MVKGKPKTEEVIPLAVLKESINKAAYGYTEKHRGPKGDWEQEWLALESPPGRFGLARLGTADAAQVVALAERYEATAAQLREFADAQIQAR